MKQIQKLCDQEWAQTGWQAHDETARDYPIWHEAFITGFKLARDLAARQAEVSDLANTAIAIRRLGEENV